MSAKKINKKDLIAGVSESTGLSKKQATDVVSAVFSTIQTHLSSGEEVSINGFGTFGLKTRKPRVGRNPKTGESIDIPEKTVVGFKPAASVAQSVNG